jgi:hypothetical protein
MKTFKARRESDGKIFTIYQAETDEDRAKLEAELRQELASAGRAALVEEDKDGVWPTEVQAEYMRLGIGKPGSLTLADELFKRSRGDELAALMPDPSRDCGDEPDEPEPFL